ncbi:MAG TPA: CDP-alcohol phosphatidyltransferase family protein [Syntrophorhabdaceae bacterium]|nr:CDP-alcohol phosphatidyltransferase family protein [Syntrophorhabdaceae bacterium]HOT42314.1 CDP-alcohol phosphatidyltransferase family protein [Syntrophorhabdaceae bacterium]HPC67434.1 CDP-alcohol phosphatidyltransferase family protein [Syntrophorhabdaceae bacterium]HQE80151.1 CDP-alcohol phosphatidyltransferase family protein [Syntrophorhabdaceae bacterium]HQH43845.1 CDP-alcohol phosphatidyltransferase family protein [Syntrophorhabdaceae bacterium]
MISYKIGHSLDPVIIKVYRFFFRDSSINPNIFTILGALFGYVCCVYIALGYPLISGIALLLSGFFDLLDGALARVSKRVTPFGGFLDSVLDRYTDLFVLYGISIYFLRQSEVIYSVITIMASIGVAIIPYAKARAEAASLRCNTGILERPERIIILLIGLFFNLLPYAVIVTAVLSHITVIQRIVFVWRESNKKTGLK